MTAMLTRSLTKPLSSLSDCEHCLCRRQKPHWISSIPLTSQRKPAKWRNPRLRTSAAQQHDVPDESGFVRSVRSIVDFVDSQFLPLGLLTAICLGYFMPGPAVAASQANLGQATTFIIFIMSGLQMRRGEALDALSSWPAYLYGMAAILFVTPLLARIALASPLHPAELTYGLAVFCCMPTSLSANIALASAVGANTAMSLLLTVTSSIFSVFTMPFMLAAVLSMSGSISFDPVVMIGNLVKTVLVPLMIGACFRTIAQVRKAIDGNKKLVRNLSTLCLVTVPYTQIGMSKLNGDLAGLTAESCLLLAATTWLVLGSMRLINLAGVRMFRLGGGQPQPEKIQRAVVLAASQKTLPVAIAVLAQMTDVIGSAVGLASIPCVFAHFSQVMIDSMLVDKWKRHDAQLVAQPA